MIIPVLLLGATLGSCKKGGVFCYKGDGNIVTEERAVSNFTEVALSMSGNVYVEQGSEYSCKIETSQNLLPIIETEVKNGVLEIDLKRHKCLKGDSELNVYVTAPLIEGLVLSGSGNIRAFNQLETSSMSISISGSGRIDLDSLQTQLLDASISGSGDMHITGVGNAMNQEISISGSGSVYALDFPTERSNISISGSGNCEVQVLDELNASISGSGNVRYLGTPKVSSQISGSGTVAPY